MTLRPQSPWYNVELAKDKQRRWELERKYRKTRLVVDRDKFNEHRTVYNAKLTAAKQSFYKDKIESSTNSRDRFKTCNNLLNRGQKVLLPSHECAKELADRFITFFSDKI